MAELFSSQNGGVNEIISARYGRKQEGELNFRGDGHPGPALSRTLSNPRVLK
jgi:hypothetical protein